MIPKILMQTSKVYNKNLEDRLSEVFPDWQYRHFDDEQSIEYMQTHKIEGIDDPVSHWKSYTVGAHRADYFRYYFLYINGGGFLDSDCMVYENIEDVLEGQQFVSCDGYPFFPNSLYQGFLFAEKESPIIFKALKKMHDANDEEMSFVNGGTIPGYLKMTYDIYDIYAEMKDQVKCRIIEEELDVKFPSPIDGTQQAGIRLGYQGRQFAIHWQTEKIIHDWDILDNNHKVVFDKVLGPVLFPKTDSIIAPAIEAIGSWEPDEVRWIENNVSSGMTCINAGANVGYHAMMLSRATGQSGEVFSYEPSSEIFNFLEKNIYYKNMNNVKNIKKAVGANNGTISLFLNDKNCGDNRCFNPQNIVDRFGTLVEHGFAAEPRSEEVELVTLDSEFPRKKIDIIFMDVQGLEFDVLDGAKKIIKKHKPTIVFEFTPAWYEQLGIDYLKKMDEIVALGSYEMFMLLAEEEKIDNLSQAIDFINSDRGNKLYVNVILRSS